MVAAKGTSCAQHLGFIKSYMNFEKSRAIFQALSQSRTEKKSHEPSLHYSSWDSTISMYQAYIDLMKSSWILEEVVLCKEVYEDLPQKEITKMILELSRVG